jgi:polyferredoxin
MPSLKRHSRFPIRTMVQTFFFILIGYFAFGKSLATIMPSGIGQTNVSLHAICPFGGVVTIYNVISAGTTIQKIHDSAIVLAGLAVILAVLAGPVICGWVCPLGTIQDWIGKLGRLFFKRRYNKVVPPRIHKILSYLRYLVLFWVVYMTAASGKLLFEAIDPYYALFHFWTSEAALGGVILLSLTLVGSLLVSRPWCKYLCPYGALLGLFNKLRIFTIRRQAATCISCNRCDRVCPMNIKVSKSGSIRDTQCISCLECTSDRSCPVNDTVLFEVSGKRTTTVDCFTNKKEEQI